MRQTLARHLNAQSARRRHIRVLHVVRDHAVRAETPGKGRDRVLHESNPLDREPVLVAIVVGRNHLMFQDVEQRVAVSFVRNARIDVRRAVPDREAVRTVVRFRPPSVENREVQRPVEHRLLTARTRRLLRTTRIVQPDVDPLNKVSRYVNIVVFQENDAAREFRIPLNANDSTDHVLADIVRWVRFTGENELNRSIRVINELIELLLVLHDEERALVFRKPAREPDRKRVRIENVLRLPLVPTTIKTKERMAAILKELQLR